MKFNTEAASRRRFKLFPCLFLCAAVSQGALAFQAQGGTQSGTKAAAGKKAPADKPKAQPVVKVTQGPPALITVKADGVPMPKVTAELSRALKVPFLTSDLISKQEASKLEFEDLTLEAAVRYLAPQGYIDYELTGDGAAQPKPLAVYLYGYNEAPPPLTATVKGNSEVLMIEGNTEDGVDGQVAAAEEKPIKVQYEKQLLSVQSKKQPLTAVLYEIASTLGVPFELRYESKELVDTSFANYRLEDAIRRLSPNVRLYYRADLQRSENTPLRLVLVAPASR
jgi:hypothetical protein